jgi:hypothetical protein
MPIQWNAVKELLMQQLSARTKDDVDQALEAYNNKSYRSFAVNDGYALVNGGGVTTPNGPIAED